MRNCKDILPDNTPIDHIVKQGIYSSYLKKGVTEEAKKTFQRPPFYKTVSEPRHKEQLEETNDPDKPSQC